MYPCKKISVPNNLVLQALPLSLELHICFKNLLRHSNFRYFRGKNFHLDFSASNETTLSVLSEQENAIHETLETLVKTVMLRYNESQREKNS